MLIRKNRNRSGSASIQIITKIGRHYYSFETRDQCATGIYFIKLFVNNKIYVERVIKVILPE
jgi:hypothetical protein